MNDRRELRGAREEEPKASAHRLLAALGLTLAIVIGVNAAAGYYLRDHTSNLGYLLVREKWRLLSRQSQPVDVLVLGDSTCNQGLNNGVLNTALGVTSLNLCTVGGGGLVHNVWLLREYLRTVGVPGQVVVVHTYDVWRRQFKLSLLGSIPSFSLLWRQRELPLDSSRFVDALVASYVPLYAEETTIKALLRERDAAKPRVLRLDEFGFMPVKKARPRAVKHDARKAIKALRAHEDNVGLSEDNRRAAEALAELAVSRGVNVTIVNGPIYAELGRNARYRRHVERIERSVSEAFANKPGVVHCKNTFPLPAGHLENADHATLEGSKLYTAAVAELLGSRGTDQDRCER